MTQEQPNEEFIAHYRLIREIGRGGQATVHLAMDTKLHRRVALKVMHRGHGIDHGQLARFRREAEITSKLNNPGICPVFEAGEDRGALWIAMAYVEGEPLSAKIASEKHRSGSEETRIAFPEGDAEGLRPPMSPSEGADTPSGPKTWTAIAGVLRLFEETARILHIAHEHGVIHRDMKPGNIMVRSDGTPVILDFGLAQDVDSNLTTLTEKGDLLGTPAYMSPEQLAAQRIRLDRRKGDRYREPYFTISTIGATFDPTSVGATPWSLYAIDWPWLSAHLSASRHLSSVPSVPFYRGTETRLRDEWFAVPCFLRSRGTLRSTRWRPRRALGGMSRRVAGREGRENLVAPSFEHDVGLGTIPAPCDRRECQTKIITWFSERTDRDACVFSRALVEVSDNLKLFCMSRKRSDTEPSGR